MEYLLLKSKAVFFFNYILIFAHIVDNLSMDIVWFDLIHDDTKNEIIEFLI